MDDATFERLITLPENDLIDYKERSHVFNNDVDEGKFIKDILSFSNSIRDESAYIISGIRLSGSQRIFVGDNTLLDDAILQQKLENKIFPKPKFTAEIFNYRGLDYGIIEIKLHPYHLPLTAVRDFKKCVAGEIYIRRSSSNSKADGYEIIAIQQWLEGLANSGNIVQEPEPESVSFFLPPVRAYDPVPDYISRKVSPADGDPLGMMFREGNSLFDVVQKHKRIALLGWGLSGKSTELKQLAYELSAKGDVYPYLIPLGNHIDESIAERIGDIQHVPDYKLFVLLDGLDEVLPDHFERARRKISQFVNEHPLATVVVSCRTNFYTTATDEFGVDTLTDFESFKLQQLDYDQIERYIEEFDPQNKKRFFKEVAKKQAGELLSTPYYLVKLTQQYRDTQKISDNKAALFEMEIKQLIRKEIAKKHTHGQEGFERHLLALFRRLAFIMEAKGTNEISSAELEKVFPDLTDYENIVNAGSIFYRVDSARNSWKFNHNNTQEYLAAEVLMAQSFKKVQRIIGIGPQFKRVKPSWVNTLSFLTSILPKDNLLKKKITNWLVKYNRELVVMLEPEKIGHKLRIKTFKAILEDYQKDGRRINRTIYRPENLAAFSESKEVFDYLLQQFRLTDDPIVINNALEVINFYNIRNYHDYYESFKSWYEKFLFGEDTSLHYLALIGYTALFTLTTEEFEKVYLKFKDSDDTWIRFQLFQAIWTTGNQEVLIGYVLEQAKLLIKEDRRFSHERKNKNRLSNEYSEIAKCLEGIRSSAALIKMFSDLKDEFVSFAHSTYFGKTLNKTLANAAKFPKNTKLISKIDQIFLANHSYILHDPKLNQAFRHYYTSTNQLEQLLHKLYGMGMIDFSVGHSIAALATTEFIEFLFTEHQGGRISVNTVDTLERFMETTANPNLGNFRDVFVRPAPPELPPRDWKSEEISKAKRNLAALFDKSIYLHEVEKIFTGLGKSTITYNDTYSHSGEVDYWGEEFLTVAREALDLSPHTCDAVLTEVKDHIEACFDTGFISRIYAYLLRHNDAELNEDQRKTITQWCDQKSESINFKNAIDQERWDTWYLDEDTVMFSYFVRALKLDHYSEALYLDMTQFIKYDDQLIDLIPFVESVLGFEKTQTQLLLNLNAGITNSRSLGDHLKFIEEHQIRSAVPLLINYLMGPEDANHYQLLKIFLQLGGTVNNLKGVLKQSKGYFRDRLIEEFVREGGKFISKYLEQKFAEADNDDEKLGFARFLIRLQNEKAVLFYINYIRTKGLIPDDSSPHNPLYWLRKRKFVPHLLDLYELAQQPRFYQDSFKDLRTISFNALKNIAFHENNFPKVEQAVKKWMKAKRSQKKSIRRLLPINLFTDLYFYLENFGREFYGRVVMLDLNASIKLYEKLYHG